MSWIEPIGKRCQNIYTPLYSQNLIELQFYDKIVLYTYRCITHENRGAPLPVTLSSFKATRTADGAVINWTTESELDNAGFNILRSRTKTDEFVKINAKLIQGTGTTSKRNTYTWTDTTAKPNTVYYYRIEDVSHAGVHQTLTTTRLQGLISAKGKMVTQWASFKTGR